MTCGLMIPLCSDLVIPARNSIESFWPIYKSNHEEKTSSLSPILGNIFSHSALLFRKRNRQSETGSNLMHRVCIKDNT